MHQWILFITVSMEDYAEQKKTEQNLIVRSGKSKADV